MRQTDHIARMRTLRNNIQDVFTDSANRSCCLHEKYIVLGIGSIYFIFAGLACSNLVRDIDNFTEVFRGFSQLLHVDA
jgi:hypothetical protein